MYEEAVSSSWPVEAVVLREGTGWKGPQPDHLFLLPASDFDKLSNFIQSEGIITVLGVPDSFSDIPLKAELPPGPGFLLDAIQDPGNLGTILRTASWFGFQHIVCGPGTVDVLNPKVLRASMGAVFQLNIYQMGEWTELIRNSSSQIWLADLDGVSADQIILPKDAWILLGNEANGISPWLDEITDIHRILIPRFGQGESLNVSISAAILAWKLRMD